MYCISLVHCIFCGFCFMVESSWNLMAHGDAWEGKWRGNWQMEWVAGTLTLPRNTVYPALLPLMRTPRLPAVAWTDTPADLNWLVRFAERRNLVSAHVPSHFKHSLLSNGSVHFIKGHIAYKYAVSLLLPRKEFKLYTVVHTIICSALHWNCLPCSMLLTVQNINLYFVTVSRDEC